jgi:hypothetical protein
VSLFLAKKRLTPLLGCSKLNIIPWHPAFDCKIARCADLSSQVKMTVKAVNIIAGLLIGFLADGSLVRHWGKEWAVRLLMK